ncbi:HAD family hydrolase [Actinoalloteichus spitiensis]|uniref:HAD family hydrolase n=1 Tax=Actinoalloteichus spitiensis TaxID=252394 RepID=UPI000372DD61|nr:HAD family hydrolase [Actinoalloteichus spitiensis]
MTRTVETTATRHIVWDWNGTLLDDNHAVMAGVNAVCRLYGRDEIELDYWRDVFSRPLQECYTRLLGRELSPEDWAELDALYHRSYDELLHTCDLSAGARDVLRSWGEAGGSQSLLSMWFHTDLVPLITKLGLVDHFRRVDGLRDDVGGGSKAEHLDRHLRELDLSPSEVVLVGDVLDDAAAAGQVGTGCVLVTTGMTAPHRLLATGYPVANSLAEAAALARTPGVRLVPA